MPKFIVEGYQWTTVEVEASDRHEAVKAMKEGFDIETLKEVGADSDEVMTAVSTCCLCGKPLFVDINGMVDKSFSLKDYGLMAQINGDPDADIPTFWDEVVCEECNKLQE